MFCEMTNHVLNRFDNMTTQSSICKLSNDQCHATSEPIQDTFLYMRTERIRNDQIP